MKQRYGRTIPDMIGFMVVGGTAGFVATGGADRGVTAQTAIGCLCGALLPPAAVTTRWTRLLRLRWARGGLALSGEGRAGLR